MPPFVYPPDTHRLLVLPAVGSAEMPMHAPLAVWELPVHRRSTTPGCPSPDGFVSRGADKGRQGFFGLLATRGQHKDNQL